MAASERVPDCLNVLGRVLWRAPNAVSWPVMIATLPVWLLVGLVVGVMEGIAEAAGAWLDSTREVTRG
jgi:hypothetical protein